MVMAHKGKVNWESELYDRTAPRAKVPEEVAVRCVLLAFFFFFCKGIKSLSLCGNKKKKKEFMLVQ